MPIRSQHSHRFAAAAANRRDPLAARALAELDADPAAAALRGRAAASGECGIRAMRGAWAASVLRALWRAARADSAEAAPPPGARR